MKVFRLVSGIICFVLSLFILFQSCAAGMYNALSENGEVSGTAGILVTFLMIAGGVVEVAARNSVKKGSTAAIVILFLFAALLGFAAAGEFSDLKIWAGLCAVIAAVNAIGFFRKPKPKAIEASAAEEQ